MEINYKDNKNKEVAEDGLIVLGCDFAYSSGNGWFELATGYKENLKEGNYKIIAKVKDWEINIK